MKDLGLDPSFDSLEGLSAYPRDKALKEVMKEHENDYIDGLHDKDQVHPTDSSRTRLGDIESMLLKY